MSKPKRIEQDEAAEGTTLDNVVELPRPTVAERRDTAVAFIKDHPGLALAGGLAVGVLVASLLPRRPRTKLGKRGAKLGDAVTATAALLARRAVDRAETTGEDLRRGSRYAAKRSEDLGEQAAHSIGVFLSSLLDRAGHLTEDAADGAGKLGKRAAKRLAKASDQAEDAAAFASRRIGKAASDAKSKIIG